MELCDLSKIEDSKKTPKELKSIKTQISETVNDLYWSVRGFEQDLSAEKKKEYNDIQKKFFEFKDAFDHFKPE